MKNGSSALKIFIFYIRVFDYQTVAFDGQIVIAHATVFTPGYTSSLFPDFFYVFKKDGLIIKVKKNILK